MAATLVAFAVGAVIFFVGARYAPPLPIALRLRLRHDRTQAWRAAAEYGEWLLTALWMWRTNEAIRRIGDVPDISQPEWDLIPPDGAAPSLTVVVPARNEAENIGATLETLVAQQYTSLRVLAIDDRSTDKTRQIVDEFAERYPDRIGAIHIDYLPGRLAREDLRAGGRNAQLVERVSALY